MKTKEIVVPVPREQGRSFFAKMLAAVETGDVAEAERAAYQNDITDAEADHLPTPQAHQTEQPSRPPIKVSAVPCVHSTPRKRSNDPRNGDWRLRATPKSDWD